MDDEMHVAAGYALAKSMRAHGVGAMFGMGGFQLLPFYDGVQRLGLEHHLINDERTGAFAADAYARITGRPGVCDATLGPGATNLLTALAESTNAGVPLIAITGDANRSYAGRHMTQETNQVDSLRPVVKDALRVEDPKRMPEFVRRAFAVATSGRAGSVVLDVPEDVAHAEVTYSESDFWVDAATCRIPARRTRPDDADLEAAAALLRTARRPVVLVGGGVHLSSAYDELDAFTRAWQLPIAHTMSGKGAIACDSTRSIGIFGRYSRIANDIIKAADLIVVVGCKMGEVATERYALIPETTPLIHVDIVAEEFGRTARPTVSLWGDAAATLSALGADAPDQAQLAALDRPAYEAEISARRSTWLESVRPRLESDEQPINVARLVTEIGRSLPEDGILVADGGFAAHWTGLLFDTKRAGRGYVANRGLASIGYGVPGALGASLADRGRPVVAVTGDGGLNMSLGDLETLKRAGVSPTIVVVNNAASGYIKALQHMMFDGRYQSADLVEMDYAQIARAMGCNGTRVTDPADLSRALLEAIDCDSGPTVIDVVVTRDASKMLPGVDKRAAIKKGDRIA